MYEACVISLNKVLFGFLSSISNIYRIKETKSNQRELFKHCPLVEQVK